MWFFVLLLALWTKLAQCEPGYLDFDNLPETNFTCAGKVIGGYYADLETSCQMFHVCTIGQLDEPMDIKFLCLNGTVFDQETRVCERVDEVDCSRSERFYYLNLELYGNTMVPISEDAADDEDSSYDGSVDDSDDTSKISSYSSSSARSPSASTTSTTTTPTTTTTSTTTTTRRPSTATTIRSYYSSSSTTTQRPPQHKISVKPLPPKNVHIASTVKPVHYATTFKTSYDDQPQLHHQQQHQHQQHSQPDEIDYEYEDDYAATDGKDLGNFHDTSGTGNHDGLAEQVFSPQQFIFNQNGPNSNHPVPVHHHIGVGGSADGSVSSQPKPAISFQQQQFQNGGSLTVTNSHVTVTTHTDHATGANKAGTNGNKQFSSRPKQTSSQLLHGVGGPSTAEEDHDVISGGYTSASTRKPEVQSVYSLYGAPPPLSQQSGSGSSINTANKPTPVFRLPAHGFRLPSPEQAEALVAAQNKHAAELQRHREQIEEQLKQQHDQSPQEQHLRELEQHQRRLEQLQQQELGKQLREQEKARREQEQQRQELERLQQQQQQQQLQQQQQQHRHHQPQLQTQATAHGAFEGYQRLNPQVTLRLPLEHNPNQPQFLALAKADSDFPQREHRDTKRSDPHASSSISITNKSRTQTNPQARSSSSSSSSASSDASALYPSHASEYRESITSSSSRKSHQIVSAEEAASKADASPPTSTLSTSNLGGQSSSSASITTTLRHGKLSSQLQTSAPPSKRISHQNANSSHIDSTTVLPMLKSSTTSSRSSSSSSSNTTATSREITTTHSPQHHSHHHQQQQTTHHYDHHRVLLTPQDQYIPTLPKIIITASASVSDANGKKLNYSLGNAIGPNVKIPPPSYDEYRDDDVVLDPFYLDVPKIRPQLRRNAREAAVEALLRTTARPAQRRKSGFAKRKRKK